MALDDDFSPGEGEISDGSTIDSNGANQELHESSEDSGDSNDLRISERSKSDESSHVPSRKRQRPPEEPLSLLFKRAKITFNPAYLELLNEDIEHAAIRFIPSISPPLPEGQLGAITWTSQEKEAFFTAVARLGKDNSPAISSRVGSKSELEVRQFIALLEDEKIGGSHKDDQRWLRALHIAEHPAAVELSQECCAALEAAADDLSIRQESYEDTREKDRWGDKWCVTEQLARDLTAQLQDGKMLEPDLEFVTLFDIPTWLRLSSRIFMNASYPENNWRYISEETPSIRSTAMKDFRTLIISITKRLVATTLFISQSRIRKQKPARPQIRNIVRKKDVKAAAVSIGLKTDSQSFWAKAPRRLRLDIIDDADFDDGEERILQYGEVERLLLNSPQPIQDEQNLEDDDIPDSSSEHEDSTASSEDEVKAMAASIHSVDITTSDENDGQVDPKETDIERTVVDAELREALIFSAMERPQTVRGQQSLRAQIKAERAREQEAEEYDRRVNTREEAGLWNILRPHDSSLGMDVDQPQPPKFRGKPDVDIGDTDWRQTLRYHSSWEEEP